LGFFAYLQPKGSFSVSPRTQFPNFFQLVLPV
jgi:hypothetical protein